VTRKYGRDGGSIRNVTMKKKTSKENVLAHEISIGGVTLTQQALFAKHLAVAMRAGMTVVEALEVAQEASSGKLKRILLSVLESVRSGNPLADALARYPRAFPGLLQNVVRAGEASGSLEENLEHVAEQLEKEHALRSKVRGAMVYPVVILVATFVLGIGLTFGVLPKITPLFESLKVELPLSTRMLIAFSTFVQNNVWSSLIAITVTVVGLIWLFRQPFIRPVTHAMLLRIPIVKNIVINVNVARFSRTLGTLLRSGVPVTEALTITGDTIENLYYRRAVASITKRVSRGSKLASNLRRHATLFPMMATRMIQVGEGSGKLDETLLYLASFHEGEVDTSTKALATTVEPFLLLFIGLAVGFLAISIITPIYNITGNVK
jgi:type IV pilus assembly protein PilC